MTYSKKYAYVCICTRVCGYGILFLCFVCLFVFVCVFALLFSVIAPNAPLFLLLGYKPIFIRFLSKFVFCVCLLSVYLGYCKTV